MSSFKNKNVLITGGASGIGFLMAQKALEEEAKTIVLWDLNKAALEEARQKLDPENNTIKTYLVDVSDPKNVSICSKQVFTDVGTIDILFNNAGIVVGKDFAHHTYGEIEKTIGVNTLGFMYVCRAFLQRMIDSKEGHIINITSAAGLMPNPGMTVYAASKWAAVGWSESLRIELEKYDTGVHVTTVMPSYIDTGMFEGVTPPLLVPWLKPHKIVNKIFKAVKQNKITVKAPFMVNLTPFLRGILPSRIFDYIAGKIFRVYDSMNTFKGRNNG